MLAHLRSTGHVAETLALQFRRAVLWNATSGFLQPLLFLLGLGVGVGTLVDRNVGSAESLGGLTYAAFVAPGLLATAAMTSGSGECMWPVLGRFKWDRTYHAMAATPITPADIVLGQLAWLTIRLFGTTTAIALVLACVPQTRSSGLLVAVPAAVLCGLAMSMPVAWFSSRVERDNSFAAYQRFVVNPLFLFGDAFYPIGQLPGWLQTVIRVTPLWHGIEIARSATTHTLGTVDVAHAAYLAAWVVVATVLCIASFTTRLER